MRHRPKHEDEVLSAIREFAQSVNYRDQIATKSKLVDVTSRIPLSNLDRWERLIRWEASTGLQASNSPKWKLRKKPDPGFMWLDLCSGDGFQREKTLNTLSGAAPNSFFLVLAVRRLNDWVPQVRKAARAKLPLIVKESDPEQVVEVLCAILPYWNSWGRMEDADKEILLEFTTLEAISHSLKMMIISKAAGPMISILSQVGRLNTLDNYLVEIAAKAIQPAVRAKAYRTQLEGKMVWFEGRKWEWTDVQYCKGRFKPILSERSLAVSCPFLETLRLAAADHSSMVRRVAGDVLIQELTSIGEESLKLAKLLASDSSPSVAERGIYALKKLTAVSERTRHT